MTGVSLRRELLECGFTYIQTDRWGVADIEAAIAAIPEWIKIMGWNGPNVNVDQRLVTGHSNGGRQPHQSRVFAVI